MRDGELVYSTDGGNHRRRTATKAQQPAVPNDGIVRVFRDKSGRGGKTVTLVRGLPAREVDVIARELKRLCGAGGAVKDGAVEIQGDHRDKIAAHLEARGHRVKLAGG